MEGYGDYMARRMNEEAKKDMVNSPEHYNKAGIETIDALEAMLTKGFDYYLQGNIVKYLWRFRYKNGIEDLLLELTNKLYLNYVDKLKLTSDWSRRIENNKRIFEQSIKEIEDVHRSGGGDNRGRVTGKEAEGNHGFFAQLHTELPKGDDRGTDQDLERKSDSS